MVTPAEPQTVDPTVEAPVAPTLDTSIDQPLLSEQDKAEIARNGRTDEDLLGAPDLTPTEAPAPTATPDVTELQAAQTKISQYEQWISDARQTQATQQQEQNVQAIQNARGQYAKHIQDKYSIDEGTASLWADEVAGLNQQLLETQMNQSAREAYTKYYAQQYKVTPESLSKYNSPEAMQLAAESASKMSRLEGQITKMQETQKAAVPVGQFDSGRSSTGVGVPDRTWLSDVYGTSKSNDHARAAKIIKAQGTYNF